MHALVDSTFKEAGILSFASRLPFPLYLMFSSPTLPSPYEWGGARMSWMGEEMLSLTLLVTPIPLVRNIDVDIDVISMFISFH